MKPSVFSLQSFLFLILFVFAGTAQAQVFETTIGHLTGDEECRDGKVIPGDKYIMLSNTKSFGATTKILLTRLSATRAVELFCTIHNGSSSITSYEGMSIELDYSNTGAHIGYFITGRMKTGAAGWIILLRTDLNGVVTWGRYISNVYSGITYDECGVSVERQTNGDVIVVGNSRNPSTDMYHVVIARFSSAGALSWCKRYVGLQFENIEPVEACNGKMPSPNPGSPATAVTAVTGRYTPQGATSYHTFFLLVNSANGAEFLRKTYNSGQLHDAGLDIVYKPAANAFDTPQYMIVGEAGGVHPAVWTVRVNTSTGAGTGAIYEAGVYNSGFLATAVDLNTTSGNVVMAGGIYGLTSPENPFFSRIFAMELPFASGALPTWTYYYQDSSPQGNASESISRKTSGATGYFITGGDRLTGSAFFDQHAIRVNTTGLHGLADCKEVLLKPVCKKAGVTTNLVGTSALYSITGTVSSVRTTRTYKQESCDGIPFAPDTAADRSETNNWTGSAAEAEAARAVLFPNPTHGGQSARILLDAPADESVQVQVFDLSGKMIWQTTQSVLEGRQEIELPSQEWRNGAYVVRLLSERLNTSLRLIVAE